MIDWIEITTPNLSILTELGNQFSIHPLAIEDCMHRDQRPKLENFGNHQFLVWFMISGGKFYEIQFIIFSDKIIFVTDHKPPKEDSWRKFFNLKNDYNGVWNLLYYVLDQATDATWEEIRRIFLEIEVHEESIFQNTFNPRSIIYLKKTLNRIENIIEHLASIPEQIQNLLKEKSDLNWKLRDLHDHCERMYQKVSMHGAQIGMIVDLYWGYQSDRVNRQIKKLSILAFLAIPATFWASFWGMNFTFIPFSSPNLFVFAIVIMVFSVIFSVGILIKKGYWSD